MNDINSLYKLWCEKAVNDKDLIPELKSVEGNQDEILDRFYKNLEFGTSVLLYGRNADSTWWFAEVDGQRGWLNGEFLVVSPACSTLPVR